jgi:hypothetical protein
VTPSSVAQRLPGSELLGVRNDEFERPAPAGSRSGELLFATLAGSFCIIYLLYYPASYSILDESSTLSLSYALAHGTIYLDRVGLTTGLTINGHIVSLYSPFHALLLAVCMMFRWRLGFALTAMFFLLGAFTVRGMLKRDGLSPGWCILYFLNPGALYYSQTLMAAVPAAVMGLLGVSLLMRPNPRTALGGLALGCSVLLHPWMGPLVVVFSTVWVVENAGAGIVKTALKLALGAAPAVALLAVYNHAITGSPILSGYSVLGLQREGFRGAHLLSFASFYLISLAVFPLAGWVVLTHRWARGWALPAASAAVLLLASLYYYRDGMNLEGSSLLHLFGGTIPGQRFLMPVSLLACVPAARFLDSMLSHAERLGYVALALFVAGFWSMSAVHENYLLAHALLQRAIDRDIPAGAHVIVVSNLGVNFGGCKEFAPVYKIWRCAQVDQESGTNTQIPEAYLMWAGPPNAQAPVSWFAGRHSRVIKARSWLWKSDIWLGGPAGTVAGF